MTDPSMKQRIEREKEKQKIAKTTKAWRTLTTTKTYRTGPDGEIIDQEEYDKQTQEINEALAVIRMAGPMETKKERKHRRKMEKRKGDRRERKEKRRRHKRLVTKHVRRKG